MFGRFFMFVVYYAIVGVISRGIFLFFYAFMLRRLLNSVNLG